jgi:hypothetical protein
MIKENLVELIYVLLEFVSIVITYCFVPVVEN